MAILGSWWSAAPPPTVKVTVRTPSGLSIVLEANRLTDGNLELVLPEHALNAFTTSVASSNTSGSTNGTTSTSSSRATTPLPAYTPAPPSYNASFNSTLSHPAPPPAISHNQVNSVVAQHSIAQHNSQPIAIAAPAVLPTYHAPPQPAPAPAPATVHAPDVYEIDYKMPNAERIWCYWSYGNQALNDAPHPSAFPSRPQAGDTYVHHPNTGARFAPQLWYYWNGKWVMARTKSAHPSGRDYVLHWAPNSTTTRWMRPGSCQKSRIPWQLRGQA